MQKSGVKPRKIIEPVKNEEPQNSIDFGGPNFRNSPRSNELYARKCHK